LGAPVLAVGVPAVAAAVFAGADFGTAGDLAAGACAIRRARIAGATHIS